MKKIAHVLAAHLNAVQRLKKSAGVFSAILFATALVLQVVPPEIASAAQITSRSLTLMSGSFDSNSDGINDGGSLPGGVANHSFAFTLPQTTGNLGSIKFKYCTTAAAVPNGIDCNAPAGLSTTTRPVTLGTSSGAATFSAITNVAANESYISRTAASFTGGAVTVQLNSVVNPTTTNTTFFVRISSYAATNATGAEIDSGSVAASTSNAIEISGTMPESLVFCTGRTISLTSLVPDCTTATSGVIAFDQLFSPTDTATARSQMAASTNAGAGYAITVNGPTLTSGSNTITRMTNGGTGPTPLILGTSQFGLNLRANTTVFDNQTTPVALGLAVAPIVNGTNYRGQARADYSTDNSFEFTGGDIVAASDNGGAGGTDAQIYTTSYVVNVPGSQPAGTYTTTLTYICTPTF